MHLLFSDICVNKTTEPSGGPGWGRLKKEKSKKNQQMMPKGLICFTFKMLYVEKVKNKYNSYLIQMLSETFYGSQCLGSLV